MKRLGLIKLITLAAFAVNILGPLPSAWAQDAILPNPGQMLHLSAKFSPPMLTGIKIYPDNPLEFDFIVEKGDSTSTDDNYKKVSEQLIRYFLAALTVPEKELWVNLSPYEKDRIIPEAFGQTEMGRDLLAEDYLLKQVTASLLYPDGEIGKRFWDKVSKITKEKYGTTDVPTNIFNKVWIVPGKAVIYENALNGTAYIVESQLKVMLEEDYEALANQKANAESFVPAKDVALKREESSNSIGSQIVREIIIPELTKEINENRHFTKLRQIYHSYILANWYKQKIKNSLLNQVYSDRNKIAGIGIDDPNEKQKIYAKYLETFEKGTYNYIKEEYDPVTEEMIPRKYFSGGVNLAWDANNIVTTTQESALPRRASTSLIVVKSVTYPTTPYGTPTYDLSNLDLGQRPANDQNGPLAFIDPSNSDITPETVKKIELIANELNLEFSHAAALLGEFMTRANEMAQASGQEIFFFVNSNQEDHDGIMIPGVEFSYRVSTSVEDDFAGVDIGRFKINRKDDTTLLLSGLFSRDTSKHDEIAPIIAPFINFDYNEQETRWGFTSLSLILIKKLGVEASGALYATDFNDPQLRPLLSEIYGESFIDNVTTQATNRRLTFSETLSLQTELGGLNYRGISLLVKILGRAAVGLTREQITNIAISDPKSFLEIANKLNAMPRKYSPSQLYPPNPAITESLIKGARALKTMAKAWDVKLELQFAAPDGLQNYLLYKAFGFELVMDTNAQGEPATANDAYIKSAIDQMNEALRTRKSGGAVDINATIWGIFRKNNFRHTLGLMRFDPNVSIDVDLQNPYLRKDIEDMFRPHAQSISESLGKAVTMTLTENDKTFLHQPAPGYTITFKLPITTNDGLTTQFNIMEINLNSARGTLWVSNLSINEPNTSLSDRALIISNDIDFNYKPQETRAAIATLAGVLEEKLGKDNYQRFMKTDLGKAQYELMLQIIIGNLYKEAVEDRIAFKGTPQERSFNEYIDRGISSLDYSDIPTVLKILAIAAVGLTQKQVEELEIDTAAELVEIVVMLNTRERMYFPTQRYPSVPALQNAVNNISKQLPIFARNAGFARMNAEVSFPDAFHNFLLYLTLGYDLQVQREMPMTVQIVQFYLGNRKIISGLKEMSWAIYRGIPEFIGIQRTATLTYDLNGEGTNQTVREKLTRIGEIATAGLHYYQKFYPERVKNMGAPVPVGALLNKPSETGSRAASPVGGIDLNPENLILITQNTNGEIEFTIDPLILKQLQNVPGFTPLIRSIQPLQNLQLFLTRSSAGN